MIQETRVDISPTYSELTDMGETRAAEGLVAFARAMEHILTGLMDQSSGTSSLASIPSPSDYSLSDCSTLSSSIATMETESSDCRLSYMRDNLREYVFCGPPDEEQQRLQAATAIVNAFTGNSDSLRINAPAITALPDCIGLLQGLHTLDLSGCTSLASLPNELHNFGQLRTLDPRGCASLKAMPPSALAMRWFTNFFLEGSGVKISDPTGSLTRGRS